MESSVTRLTGKAYAAPSLAYEGGRGDLLQTAETLGSELQSMRDMLEDIGSRLDEARAVASETGPLRDIADAMGQARAVVRSSAWRQICILQLRLERMVSALEGSAGAPADDEGRKLSIVDISG